jgi:hypothetical protein
MHKRESNHNSIHIEWYFGGRSVHGCWSDQISSVSHTLWWSCECRLWCMSSFIGFNSFDSILFIYIIELKIFLTLIFLCARALSLALLSSSVRYSRQHQCASTWRTLALYRVLVRTNCCGHTTRRQHQKSNTILYFLRSGDNREE